jgi:hydroxyacylglutathione hydrolase
MVMGNWLVHSLSCRDFHTVNASPYILHLIEVGNRLANHIYLLHCHTTGVTAAIDPTEAAPVLHALDVRGWTLSLILTTHHHADHTDGNAELKSHTACRVIGSRTDIARIPTIDVGVGEGDAITVGALQGLVMETSGHTLGHVAYYFPDARLVFSGDVMFSLGCGRVMEGTMMQAYDALQRIASLPEDTSICAAHEYTLANAAFALTIDPENTVLQARAKKAALQRAGGCATVPVLLEEEKLANPFLRCGTDAVRRTLGFSKDASEVEVFTRLRQMKDVF